MDESERRVECAQHSDAHAAFVCRHLFQQLLEERYSPIGFFVPDGFKLSSSWDGWNGWCNICDLELGRVGSWNETSEAFAGIKMVCSGCFLKAKGIQEGLCARPITLWDAIKQTFRARFGHER